MFFLQTIIDISTTLDVRIKLSLSLRVSALRKLAFFAISVYRHLDYARCDKKTALDVTDVAGVQCRF